MSPIEGRARRVIHNTFLLFGSEKAAQLFSLLVFMFLTRRWDVATYGQYALIKNWVAIFATFSDLGLNALTIREVAHRRSLAGFYLRNVMGIRSLFSMALLGLLGLVGILFHYESLIKVGLVIMGTRIVLDCISGGYVYLLQAHERMGVHGLIVVLSSVIRLLGIVLVVWLGGGIWGACAIWVLASAFSLSALSFIGIRSKWVPDFSKWKWDEVGKVLRLALPLATFWSLQMLYFRVDTVILKSLKGNEAVGLYDAAYTFLNSILSLSQLFGLSTLPVFSSAQDKKSDFGRLAIRSIKLLLFLGIPITVGGVLLARPLIVLFSGQKYLPASPFFVVLILSTVPFFISNIYINVLTVKNPKMLNLLYFTLFVMNIAFNFLLIPTWGATGAAWATVFCEWIGLGWGLWMMREYILGAPKQGFVQSVFVSLAAAGIMGLAINLDPRLYWLVLGPVIYGVGMYLFKGLDRQDMASLWSALKIYGKRD